MAVDMDGHRRQESMRQNPSLDKVRDFNRTLRAIIDANGVSHKEVSVRGTRINQTFVSLQLIGMNLPALQRVPVASPKANGHNGVSYDPEPGDEVLVTFVDGRFDRPVVIGFLFPYDTSDAGLQNTDTEAPQYNRAWQGTTEQIDKDGNRIIHVAANDTLTVVGNGSVTIGDDAHVSNLTVTIKGTANITSVGNMTLKAPLITLDTPLAQFTGNIASSGTAPGSTGAATFSGSVHSQQQVSDATRSMAADRGIYNGHTHPDAQGGNTGTPTQTE